MSIQFLFDVFEKTGEADALVFQGETYSYQWLLDNIQAFQERIKTEGVEPGTVVAIEADFSPNSIALFLALVQMDCILVPLTTLNPQKNAELCEIALSQCIFRVDRADVVSFEKLQYDGEHDYYSKLRSENCPGLVVFSSGTTGVCKGAVHNMNLILNKFKVPRNAVRAITFLMFDHLGGVNTMLYILSNGGCIVTVKGRRPEQVLETIQNHRVNLLPTSPTFIKLLLMNRIYENFDLSSLDTITYGTEPMPETTLKHFHSLFPKIRLLQTYGLSELGVMRSKSKSSDSLWVKIGGEDFKTRVVDGILHIKSKSAILGYLNAPNPFDEEGWFNTGDRVLVDGDYFRILGRKSDIINVGGEKANPIDIENVLLGMEGVSNCVVYGEPNEITGQCVVTDLVWDGPEDASKVKKLVRKYCKGKLKAYQVPVKVRLVEKTSQSERFKTERPSSKSSR